MRSRASDLAHELVPTLLFSTAVFLLLKPWFVSLLRTFQFPELVAHLPFWSIAVVVITAFFGRYLARLREEYRVWILLFYLACNVFILYFFTWPLFIYIPLLLVLVAFGFRFRHYFTTADVRTDIGLAFLLLLFNVAVRYRIPYTTDYADILTFFMAAMALGVYFNLLHLKRKGFYPHYRLSFVLFFASAVLIFVLAFVLGLPLEEGLIRGVFELMRHAYRVFAQLLIFLLYPLIWLFRPLMNLLDDIELSERQEQQPEEGPQESAEEMLEELGEPEVAEGTPIAPYIFWGLLCVVLVLIVVLIVKRLNQSRGEERLTEGVSQESESTFSLPNLSRRLKDGWSGFWSRFRRPTSPGVRYNRRDPREDIRYAYYRFVRGMSGTVPFYTPNTPVDYLQRLLARNDYRSLDAELSELTAIYNRARYGHYADSEDAQRAHRLWRYIVQNRG